MPRGRCSGWASPSYPLRNHNRTFRFESALTMHMPGLHNPTQRQQQIMQRTSALAARFSERAQVNDIASVFPHENYRDLHEAGYLRLSLPTEYGGEGADVFDMVLAQE